MQIYRTVILTNPVESIKKLSIKIESLGLNPVCMPLIETKQKQTSKNALSEIKECNWLIITSKNAFKYLLSSLKYHSIKFPDNIQIAAIGQKTADYIEKQGFIAGFISSGRSGLDFVNEFSTYAKHHQKLFFPHGNIANKDVIDRFCQDYNVNNQIVYQTIKLKPGAVEAGIVNEKKYDIIVFTSPSAVDAYFEAFTLDPYNIISIGPTTTLQLENYKLNPMFEPDNPGYEGIINEIKNYYIKKENNYAIPRS